MRATMARSRLTFLSSNPGYRPLFVLIGVLGLLNRGATLIQSDGTYLLCAASAEQSTLHAARTITGGVNSLRQFYRKPCQSMTGEERRYRTYDGTCNARNDLGAAFSVVQRFAPFYYQGKDSGPRVWSVGGRRLPSARLVSLEVHRPKPAKTKFTMLLMQIGQFLDHDISLIPVPTESDDTITCCNVPKYKRPKICFPIENPRHDHIFSDCSEFVRSEPLTLINGTVPNPRQHLNGITAWVDASMIYGNDREHARSLRTKNGTGALLKTKLYRGEERLPEGRPDDCINLRPDDFCAKAGDERVNEQPGLTAIHTVFHLEHNRLVRKLVERLLLRKGRPFSSYHIEEFLHHEPAKIHERIYQVVRKVLGAVWQKIVYQEYLPLILGPRLMSQYKLWVGRPVHYNPYIDPSIAIEFLTAAFRYGHTLVNDIIAMDRPRLLREVFSTSAHNLNHYNKIVEGLVGKQSHSQPFNSHITDSLTDHLFANSREHGVGFDLAALNIQRGRDHGIAPYNEMRRYLGLKKKRSWKEFGECELPLRRVYDHPDDVDCFTGGTCDLPMFHGVVGETFGHIIGKQFEKLKYGDRYFFETDNSYYGFRPYELKPIRRMTLAKILCENAEMPWIQENPFRQAHDRWNPTYKCSSIEDIDMWYWTYYIY